MIFALALTLVLAGPPIPHKVPTIACIQSCVDLGTRWRCVTVQRQKCLRFEHKCVESEHLECVPLIVDLGRWDPIPLEYTPMPGDGIIPPPDPPKFPLESLFESLDSP